MFKKLLFTLVFVLAGLVGLNAQTFPCGVQNLSSCNCPGDGLLVADSAPCAANSGEAQIFLLVDVADATLDCDPDTNGIVATSISGNFTAVTGDYVMYSLVYSQAAAAQIFPALALGNSIAVLQSLGTMTAPGVWVGTNPSFTLVASGLATVNGPDCGCLTCDTGSTGGTASAGPGGPGPGPGPGGTGSIGDYVFDSCCNLGGIGGVTIALYDGNQNLLGTQVTNSAGGYDFTGLSAGSYQVVVGSDPGGGALTSSGFYNVTIADGQDYNDADFSFCACDTGGTAGPGGTGCADIDESATISCLSDVTYTVTLTMGGPLSAGGFNITRPDGTVVATGAQNGYTDTNVYNIAQYPTYTYVITSITDPSCSVTIGPIVAECITTPIQLIDFDGTEAGKANYLHWTTGSEFNNDYFTLLRSEDGVNFEEVSKVPSLGNSTGTQNYEYYDYDYRAATTYYRLYETDHNGISATVGNIVVIKRKDFSFNISNIYPVPSSDIVNIDFLNENDGALSVNIYDVTGRIIEKFDVDANSGFNTLELNIGHYTVGTYFVTLSTDTETVTAKFIKD